MAVETDFTTDLATFLRSRGCFTVRTAGSTFQRDVPDLQVATPSGRAVWLEMKKCKWKSPPATVGWLSLFGDAKRAGQDEFVRDFYQRCPNLIRVCVAGTQDHEWALYAPADRPDYVRVAQGRAAVVDWILNG